MASLFTNIQQPDPNHKSLKRVLNTPEVNTRLVYNNVLDLNNEDLNKVTNGVYYDKWNFDEYIKFKNQFLLSSNQSGFIYNGSQLDLPGIRTKLYNYGLLYGSVLAARLRFIIKRLEGGNVGSFYNFNFCSENNKKFKNVTIINNLNCDVCLYLPTDIEKISGFEYINTIKSSKPDDGVLLVSFGSNSQITNTNKSGFNEYRYNFFGNNGSDQKKDLKLLIKQIKLLRSGSTKTCTSQKIYLRCWLDNTYIENKKEMFEWCWFFKEKFELKGITGIEFKGNPKIYSFIDFVI